MLENQLPTLNFKVNTSEEAIKEQGTGGSFIGSSGVYPITINFVSISQSAKGAYSYNINFTYNGNTQTIYGPTIQNTNGEENQIGARSLNKLCTIAGLTNGTSPTLEEETHNVGKNNESKTFVVATELSGLEVQLFTKKEYSKYKGEIKEKMTIESFFREDGASADEIVAAEVGKEIAFGTQLAKLLEKESTTKPRLGKDENKVQVTQEEVDAYLQAKKDSKSSSTTGAKEVKTVKKNIFA